MSNEAQGERRFCPACGQPVSRGAFCVHCGAPVGGESAVPAPAIVAAPVQPAEPPATAASVPTAPRTPAPAAPFGPPPDSTPRRKRHGCLVGCLVVVLVPLLACGSLTAFLALRPSAAESVCGAPPDESAAAALTEALAGRGIPTDSAEVWVFPLSDGTGSIAYCTVDLAEASGDSGQPMPEYFAVLGASEAARAAGITRVTLEIVDDSGQMLAITTTDAASCAAYADGSLDYDGFLGTLDGRIGPGMVTMWLGD